MTVVVPTAQRIELKYRRPWVYPKQATAIFNPVDHRGLPARYSIIEASTKAGKTVGCIIWLFEQAIAGHEGQNFWWVAPVFAQAEIAYRRMKRAIPADVEFIAKETNHTIRLPGGQTIWFKSGDNPDSLFGEDVFAAVVDEASRVRAESWYAVRSTLTQTEGPVRLIGNVKGRKNFFFNLARRAEKGADDMAYYKLIAKDAVDAGVLSEEEVADARSIYPEQVFRELYLAEPSDDGGNPFGIQHIEACVRQLSNKEPRAWGWDLAKKRDWTVGTALDEDGIPCRFLRFQKPWPETMNEILRETGSTPALVDSTGVGDPIVDQMQRELGSHFEGYLFSAPSKQKLMEGLAVGIQSRTLGVLEGPMRIEMESFEYVYTRTGVRYSAPADEHDDCVCSLALAWEQKRRGPDLSIWEKLGR